MILHDAEDIIHSRELPIFDSLIERFEMVQLSVQPLPDPQSPWIAGHYLDEFAESHGKDLVVREAFGASVPSAGVGCAIRRETMDQVIALNGGVPFDEGSVTEDYELGLKIGSLGGKGVLVRLPAASGQMVATRELFPATLDAAVPQKARWLAGIALHGWDRLGWRGGLAERWMRLRDRKAVVGALATLFAYISALGLGIALLLDRLWPWLALPVIILPDGAIDALLTFNAIMLCWRLAMRFAFTSFIYGAGEGLRAIPRALVANVIAILACFRAIGMVARSLRASSGHVFQPLAWRSGRGTAAQAVLGLELQPSRAVPLVIAIDRYAALGSKARNAWALRVSGGAEGLPVGRGLEASFYGQAGVIGLHARDGYADGWVKAQAPLVDRGRVRAVAGAAVWAGAQPGASRVDIGPTASLSARIGRARVGATVDYRIRAAGNARPGNGPAMGRQSASRPVSEAAILFGLRVASPGRFG